MKLVINKCYGGFGLSHEAMMLYAEKKGVTLYPEKDKYGFYNYFTTPEKTHSSGWLHENEIDRDDKTLVAVVEELGEKASDSYAKLVVVEIPDGVAWEIDNYDGYESVSEPRVTWG